MGYMRHHAILVSTYLRGNLRRARAEAKSLGLRYTDIVESRLNNVVTFAVVPDGSKEGWPDSDAGDTARDKFIAWLDQQRYEDGSSWFEWAEVQYGDENDDNKMTRSEANHRQRLIQSITEKYEREET